MAQQQNPYYGTGFYQPSGTYVQPQQMTAGQQQQQQQ
ncbi:spore coat protein GerQ, partial [Bacillus cereus]|nr:spore coat protein GerQ [Bacillus cereus]